MTALLAALALILAAVVPVRVWLALPSVCPSRWLGWRCPGCGMTRALALLLHGHWRAAIAQNPRVVLVAPLLLWIAFGEPRPGRRAGRRPALGSRGTRAA
jgi:hypothetical protein